MADAELNDQGLPQDLEAPVDQVDEVPGGDVYQAQNLNIEVISVEAYAVMQATLDGLKDVVGAQQKELDAQKELVAKQVQDNTKLHLGHYVQKTHQRDVEKKAEVAKFYNPHIKRTVGFCYELKYEVEDLENAWDFAMKDQIESDEEDDEMETEQKEVKKLTEEDLDKANTALQAHMLIIGELKTKIEQELYMAEAAAAGGWGTVSILENKRFTNVSGATEAEKELKTQRIRKARELYAKEMKMNKVEMPSGIGKSRRRPGQSSSLGHKRATTKFHNYHGNFGSFDGQMAGMGGPEVQTSYGQGYGGDGGYKGRGGYSNRRPGGARGGARAARTCHRCKSPGHMVAVCPLPNTQGDK